MIHLKNKEEIEIIKEGGGILAGIMRKISAQVYPGVATIKLSILAEKLILQAGAKSNFKGYNGFPFPLCVSVNNEVVHCVPSKRILQEGDIVTLDLGILWKGFHTDMAVTLPVGKISLRAKKLVEVTKKALNIGIKTAKVGNTFGDIGAAIQSYVEKEGFNVIRDLCGHGIGQRLHEDPQVLNWGTAGTGPKIQNGMVFCIEPMVTDGSWLLKKIDKYCLATKDDSLSSHFEHTIAVWKGKAIVLTKE